MKKTLLLTLIASTFLLCGCNNNSTAKKTNNDFDFVVNDSRKVEIIFDAGEGYFNKTRLHAQSVRVLKGYTWASVKALAPGEKDITNGESRFKGWLYDGSVPSDDLKFDDPSKTYVLTADYDLVKKTTVTLNYGTGKFDDKNTISFDVYVGETWGKYYDIYEDQNRITPPTDQVFNHFKYNEEQVKTSLTFEEDQTYNFNAEYVNAGNTNSFTDDNWTNFSAALNEGLDFIKTTEEGPNGGYKNAFETNGGTFVGLTRTVHMYDSDYNVVVIGEGIDPLANGTGQATLTFQFEDAVELGVSWSTGESNLYSDAKMRYYLRHQFINALPDDVIPNIVEVNKRTYRGGGTEAGVSNFAETIFLPSLCELGFDILHVSGFEVIPEPEGFGSDNKSAYPYYADPSTAPSRRIRKYYPDHKDLTQSIDVEYWVRSPDDEANGYAWFIAGNGDTPVDGSYQVDYGLAISPCFAIGGSNS